jgi:hypothetical protein
VEEKRKGKFKTVCGTIREFFRENQTENSKEKFRKKWNEMKLIRSSGHKNI